MAEKRPSLADKGRNQLFLKYLTAHGGDGIITKSCLETGKQIEKNF